MEPHVVFHVGFTAISLMALTIVNIQAQNT